MKHKINLPANCPKTPKTSAEASSYLNSLCESDVSSRSLWNRYQKHRVAGKSVKDSCKAAIAERKAELIEIDKIMVPGNFPKRPRDIYRWIESTFEEEMSIGLKNCFTTDYELSEEKSIELSLIRSINATLNDGMAARAYKEKTAKFIESKLPGVIEALSRGLDEQGAKE